MKEMLIVVCAMLIACIQPADAKAYDAVEINEYVQYQECTFINAYAHKETQTEVYHSLNEHLRSEMGVVAVTMVNNMIHNKVEVELISTASANNTTLKGAANLLLESDDYDCPIINRI